MFLYFSDLDINAFVVFSMASNTTFVYADASGSSDSDSGDSSFKIHYDESMFTFTSIRFLLQHIVLNCYL